MQNIVDRPVRNISGFIMLPLVLIVTAVEVLLIVYAAENDAPVYLWAIIPVALAIFISFAGFFIVQPNNSRVLVLFGNYLGTASKSGFWWANPFTAKHLISLRIRNFNSDKIKVNDLLGNPIEIAAVIVWRVVDSARALFDVQNYEQFVAIQSETAIRALASEYPYDVDQEEKPSLRGTPQEIADQLKGHLQSRLHVAGIEVMEARLTHLAYAPEIAQAMLRRQQAQAVVAARQKIVEGAVGMVEMALAQLSEHNIVTLDEEKKASMVNNLLVALVSESEATPVINTGTLHQ